MKKIFLASIALTLAALGAFYYVLHEEDYYPEPGSIDFYLKLSAVIRNLPVIAPQRAPAYYGTIGDGPKPAQSAVSYLTRERDQQKLVAAIGSYLQQKQFTQDRESRRVGVLAGDGKLMHEAVFIKSGSYETVEFEIWSLPEKWLEVRVAHFN